MLCGLPRVAGSRGSSLVAVCRLLMAVACLVVAHGLSCSLACGILVPWPGIEPTSPALVGRFLATGPPKKSPHLQVLGSDAGVSGGHYSGHYICHHRVVHNSGKPFKELTQRGFCKKQRVHNTAEFLWKWKEDSGSKFEQEDRGHTLKSILVFLSVFRNDS